MHFITQTRGEGFGSTTEIRERRLKQVHPNLDL
jgi:hypothetical protein